MSTRLGHSKRYTKRELAALPETITCLFCSKTDSPIARNGGLYCRHCTKVQISIPETSELPTENGSVPHTVEIAGYLYSPVLTNEVAAVTSLITFIEERPRMAEFMAIELRLAKRLVQRLSPTP